MQALILISALLTTRVQAHMRMRGPLPEVILKHSNDVSQLKKYAGLEIDDPAKGLFGLHYYYTLDVDAQRLTLKLLNSEDEQAQLAALGIIAHCGSATEDEDIFRSMSTRLGALKSSKSTRVRKLSLEAKRSLQKRIKKSQSGRRLRSGP